MTTTHRVGLMRLDAHDGAVVAQYLIDYMNPHPGASYKEFFEILEVFPHQGHNFLVLALRWFYELAKVSRPPIPMEDSVLLAKDVYTRFNMEPGMDFFYLIRPAKQWGYLDLSQSATQADAAMALVAYLSEANATHGIYDGFIKAMRKEESTLQQSFTRLVLQWCWHISGSIPGSSRRKGVAIARGICACDRALPYI